MNHNEKSHWVLLGTSEASSKIWGLSEINFPCGYQMPPGAFAQADSYLERPGSGDVWAMGGVAFEIARSGKNILESEAEQYIACYYPWVAVFCNALLDELGQRGHTIEMWDRGVSIFHGLWRQSCQMLGERVRSADMDMLSDTTSTIECSGIITDGVAPNVYSQKPVDIIHFMSQFMTLSPGDIFVQGPLVATQLASDVSKFSFHLEGVKLEVEVERWQE